MPHYEAEPNLKFLQKRIKDSIDIYKRGAINFLAKRENWPFRIIRICIFREWPENKNNVQICAFYDVFVH